MLALALKYRPNTWRDVVEQSSVCKILSRQIELDEVKNAYLFTGASGVGKTSLARLFAREVNQGKGTPIEIDAASNSGVDNVRQLIQEAKERAIDSKYKVIIIDECHSLSNQAWQAFLKCIEEPPKYTIFIFCTTDPQKIPDTIFSRVQRFNFTRVSANAIKERLAYICRNEGFTNYDEGTDYISKIANGGLRAAISMLEKCASFDTNLGINNVLTVLGNYSYDTFFELVNYLIDGREGEVLRVITEFYNAGNDLKLFVDQFLDFILNVCKFILFKDTNLTTFPVSFTEALNNCTNFAEPQNYYSYLVDRILDLKNRLKNDSSVKSTIEASLLLIARGV